MTINRRNPQKKAPSVPEQPRSHGDRKNETDGDERKKRRAAKALGTRILLQLHQLGNIPFGTYFRNFYRTEWVRNVAFGLVLLLGIFIFIVMMLSWIFYPYPVHTLIGAVVDQKTLLLALYLRTIPAARQELLNNGIYPPDSAGFFESHFRFPLRSQSHAFLRRIQRRRFIERVEENARQKDAQCRVPKHVLQSDSGEYFRPLFVSDQDIRTLHFDRDDTESFVKSHCPTLISILYADRSQLVDAWSLCALYHYGGYVFGSSVRNIDPYMENRVLRVSSADSSSCVDRGFAIFDASHRLLSIAATPRHPILLCLIDAVASSKSVVSLGQVFHTGPIERYQNSSHIDDDHWDMLQVEECSSEKNRRCCETLQLEPMSSVLESSSKSIFFRKTLTRRAQVLCSARVSTEGALQNRVSATLSYSAEALSTEEWTEKVPLQNVLRRTNSHAGWLCNRCLASPLHGSYRKCTGLCSHRYESALCHELEIPMRHVSWLDLNIMERAPVDPSERRIPRIVHQTWYEEISQDKYADISRLINSWKSSGWEYRFYTDEEARAYIASFFPSSFLDAFDSVMPGAFKADLFRYLALLREGGLYADVDVLLDTNLDALITPDLSFMAPIDEVEGRFCLWNGLVAASPGHPFLVRAVEKVMLNILNRRDVQDIEQEVCKEDPEADISKTRSHQPKLLLLSGPCLLGRAVNEALGRKSLTSFDFGWLVANRSEVLAEVGDALFLESTWADLGAARFTDLDRNIAVASTDFENLNRHPVYDVVGAKERPRRKSPHYGQLQYYGIIGTKLVYTDNMSRNEEVRFRVSKETTSC